MLRSAALLCLMAGFAAFAHTFPTDAATEQPWMDSHLSADERASLVISQMTRAEMLTLVRGWLGAPYRPDAFGPFQGNKDFHDVVGSAGYVPGIPRLGIPSLQETDASLGVANPKWIIRPGGMATALPSSLSLASSFNPSVAYEGGAMIGQEAWRKGFNVLLAGGVNLARDPRNGRNFEYLGEDPLLAGTLDGQSIRGIQDQHVISTAKHYVLNDQETNRNAVNARIDESALRASDLLAFQLAIEGGHPGAVMCSYNLINDRYSCENEHLLNGVLKGDWHYPGWVMSDWGAVHSVGAATAGLDQESAADIDNQVYFGKPFANALETGTIPASRLSDMAHRILRSMFAVGVIDRPSTKSEIDYKADGEVALHAAQEGLVLLKNAGNLLPLTAQISRIAVIGGYADFGVLSGGGSSQVYPAGLPAATVPVGHGEGPIAVLTASAMILDPSAPLGAIRAQAPHADVRFDTGRYATSAARLAKWADVVIVFATQWTQEGEDAPDLTLPQGQDELISAVAAANARTIVVLETGGPVTMPWLGKVGAVVEAWYPGQRGGEAIADVLFGAVNPSGHLPITFPKDLSQTPRPETPGIDLPEGVQFDIDYREGSDVGYRWFARNNQTPLFSFGHGLSYTTFNYSNLTIEGGQTVSVGFDVTNTGAAAGEAVPQIYLMSRTGRPLQRLIGFAKLTLNAGQKQHVSLSVDPRLLADFDTGINGWRVPAGTYTMMVGRSANESVLTGSTAVDGRSLPP